MLEDYFLLLPIAAGTLFLAVLGYVTVEEALLERRRRVQSGRMPTAIPAGPEPVAAAPPRSAALIHA